MRNTWFPKCRLNDQSSLSQRLMIFSGFNQAPGQSSLIISHFFFTLCLTHVQKNIGSFHSMANVDQIVSRGLTATPLDASAPAKEATASSWSTCYALKVRYPADIIQIFHTDESIVSNEVPTTRFWSGNEHDESLLAGGQYVLLEVKNRSSLISKSKVQTEIAENPKILIPLHTAERIGFTRLANVGPVVQKTANYTYTMERVASEEECQGTTAFHFKNEIFRLDTKLHNEASSGNSIVPASSEFSWRQSYRGLFSLKMVFVMVLGRYGLSWANANYNFLDNDPMKLWVKNTSGMIVDYFFRADKSPTWFEIWSSWMEGIW